ncbi:hypothetical protein GCM10009119_42400 [Algoriphagus jejuensis]|uniref:Uncharacterized protein n=1 Tax=Algoriphagus jejuensis TaxID=419934 RepID=A0ABN1N6H1_9BACT
MDWEIEKFEDSKIGIILKSGSLALIHTPQCQEHLLHTAKVSPPPFSSFVPQKKAPELASEAFY